MLCANYSRRTKSHIMSHEAAKVHYTQCIYCLLIVRSTTLQSPESTISRVATTKSLLMYDDDDDRPDHESKIRREMTTCPTVRACVCYILFILFIFFFRCFYYFHRFVIIIRRNSSRIYIFYTI